MANKVFDVNIEFDKSKLSPLWQAFMGQQWATLQKKAMNSAAKSLKERARRKFIEYLPAAEHRNPKYSDSMSDALWQGKAEEVTGAVITHVDVLGSRKSTSGTFRARFYEVGAPDRKTSDGKSRGSIKPLHYLEDSTDGWDPMVNVNKILEDYIKEINSKA